MSIIAPNATGQTNTGTGASNTTDSSPTAGMGEEFNSFIKLLTAQVRNQDPLSPMDSTQFVEQLATFSTLEQQVRGNESLESIATMMNDLHAIIASEWLGQTVSVESSWLPYQGDPVEFTFDVPDGIDKAVLTIRDTDGEVVWTQTLDPSDESQSWEGQTQDGSELPADSLLQFGIDLYRGAEYAGTVAPRIITTVTNVATEQGEMRIGTSAQVSSDIGGVRKVGDE